MLHIRRIYMLKFLYLLSFLLPYVTCLSSGIVTYISKHIIIIIVLSLYDTRLSGHS
jgi:hypothetical protein